MFMEECRRLDRRGPGSGFVLSMAKGEGAAVRFPPVVGGLEAQVWGWHWEVAGVREV